MNQNPDIAVLISQMQTVGLNNQEIKRSLEKLNDRFDDLDKRQTTIEGKVGAMAVIQSVFTVIASSVAAFLGSRRI